ncbi:IQ calmodulin-binding motif-containing protein 1-like isoform X2 [Cryptotermes secundus]|uniref:IQ calmodulin-binding motif-containing protein 1-like isoform X2 n=1 Tax=Cryptotermes secundus TaxID=105785 RepID=UPI000CD7DF4E|nr:IQ calmodulin-binding motif-containing protein 1-like isoform X2 [Cryptotermes secundus]
MSIQTWLQRRNTINRRRFVELNSDVLNIPPADTLAFCLNNLEETAARRIQTAWRGYRARWKRAEVRDELRREKAAVTIQRKVRHWLHTRAERQECKPCHPVNRISERRLQQLQLEVSRWKEDHQNIKFPGMKQMLDVHLQVQNRLTSFYCHVSEGIRRQQHEEARCAQLEALSMLMNEMPALSQNEDVDISWYSCCLPFAAAARLAHKRQLQSVHPLWRHKLKS